MDKKFNRVITPALLQMEATECGAASLGIILSYYKKHVPLEELRLSCGVSRNGSSVINILRAARNYGCTAKAYKKEIEKLKETKMPVIIFWQFRHFLVLEGFSKRWVYINDPGTGPRKISYGEFGESFSGLVLTISPGENFEKGGRPFSVTRSLFSRLSELKKILLLIVWLSFLLILPGIIMPYILRVFVDQFLFDAKSSILISVAFGTGFLFLYKFIFTYLRYSYLLDLENKLSIQSSNKFFWHVLHLPIVFFNQRMRGEIVSRLALNDYVSIMLSREVGTNMFNLIMILFFIIVMWIYNPMLTVASVIILIVNASFLEIISRTRKNANQQVIMERGKLTGISMSGLQMIETFKANGSESDFFKQWAGYQTRVLNAQQKFELPSKILSVVPSFLFSLGMLFIIVIGGYQIISENMTVGQLIAFQFLFINFSEPVNRLVNLTAMIQEIDANLKRLDDVLDYPAINKKMQEDGPQIKKMIKLRSRHEITVSFLSLGNIV